MDNHPRVLHVYRTYYPDPPGGIYQAIREISLGCAPKGIDSRIFTLSPNPVPHEIEAEEGKILRSRSWAAPASCDLGGPDAFLRFKQAEKWADIVHYHFPWPFADLLRCIADSNKPAVMTYHSDIIRQKILGYLYRPLMLRTLKAMSAVVATSPTYARTSDVLRAHVLPDRLHVIPLGIGDYANVPVQGTIDRLPQTGRPYFLALGVLRYYKGFHTLVEAAAAVNADIVIAGSGPEIGHLVELRKQHGANNVHFAGQVTEDEKKILLSSCLALVLPSHIRTEAFGMVLVEAAMHGKPMITCEIGSGTSYVNLHDETGIVIPPEQPAALAQAMNTLANDPQLVTQYGQTARQRYESLFSREALGAAYTNLYQQMIQESRQ